MKKKKTFAFIGAGVPSLLEAISKKKLNNKIIVFEKTKTFGGAWAILKENKKKISTENAIHYLLPNKKGVNFLNDKLKIKLEESKNKFRIFKINKIILKISYNSILSKIFSMFKNKFIYHNNLFQYPKNSLYFKFGALDLIKKIEKIIKKNNIKIQFNTQISSIIVNPLKKKITLIDTKKNKYLVDFLVITNSSNFENLYIENNKKYLSKVCINKRKLIRPAAHYFFKCNQKNLNNEIIFENDNIIKHCHDVTRFSDFNSNIKIIIIAFHPNIKKNKKYLRNYVVKNLIKLKILNDDSKFLNEDFKINYLPVLSENTLNTIRKKSFNLIQTLQTEDFCKCMGKYANQWKNI